MQDLIPINILIGDRSYRIRVSPQDEQTVRQTVKTINDKIIEFKTDFAGKDMQDYIAMALIWFATLTSAERGTTLPGAALEKLQNMEAQLDEALAAGR